MKLHLLSASILLAAVPAFAQSPAGPGGPPPPGGPRMARGFGPAEGSFGMFRPPVTNAPYSATFTSTSSEKLQDGTPLTRTSTRVVSRDSLGRTREAITLPARRDDKSGKTHTEIVIFDPVAKTVTQLQTEKKIAMVHTIPDPKADGRRGPGPQGADAGTPPMPGGRGRGPRNDSNVVDLGSKTIDGVIASGKRVTRTLPAGPGGSDKPLVATHEQWISPDLKIELSSTDTDPFHGTHTLAVSGLTKAEPDAALFKVPDGYTVQQAPQRAFGRGPGRPGGRPGPGGPPQPPTGE